MLRFLIIVPLFLVGLAGCAHNQKRGEDIAGLTMYAADTTEDLERCMEKRDRFRYERDALHEILLNADARAREVERKEK